MRTHSDSCVNQSRITADLLRSEFNTFSGWFYSILNACMGSTDAARPAGATQASSAATRRRRATPPKTAKSMRPTPNRALRIPWFKR
jgi:hypothetical protein